MAETKARKVYVTIAVEFGTDGRIVPRTLCWKDGRRYEIGKVLDYKPAASMRAGGQGDSYTLRINGQERYIFFERSMDKSGNRLGCWFVEKIVA